MFVVRGRAPQGRLRLVVVEAEDLINRKGRVSRSCILRRLQQPIADRCIRVLWNIPTCKLIFLYQAYYISDGIALTLS